MREKTQQEIGPRGDNMFLVFLGGRWGVGVGGGIGRGGGGKKGQVGGLGGGGSL